MYARSKQLVFAAALGFASPVAQPPRAGGDAACLPASTCCRICDKGKACGNTCISRKLTCHQDKGCACNVADVCAD